MSEARRAVRVTAARMALVSSKPLNVNGAYIQTGDYLVRLTGPAGGVPASSNKDESEGAERAASSPLPFADGS